MKRRTIHIDIPVPDDVTPEQEASVRQRANEAAVVELWQADKLSIRQAARALGIGYYDFLDLLAERGIPVVRDGPDAEAVKRAENILREQGQPCQ